MCVYLYIHNKYTQYTLIYYANKTFILDAINRLTALILKYFLILLMLFFLLVFMLFVQHYGQLLLCLSVLNKYMKSNQIK